ncbi:MAG: DUF5011 domain-containing protein [Chitinispirillaceae bacterium]|nr:DUF5011 domain-containing protein [Chitinispirillaceae bacterium]
MIRKLFHAGVRSFIVVIVLFQCSQIEFNNPIDLNGDAVDPRVLSNPDLLNDLDENGQADLFDLADTTHPVIKILLGDTVSILKDDPNNQLALYLDPASISVTDQGGGPITIFDPQYDVNIFKVNTVPYTIKYSAQDTSNNVGTTTRYVYVVEQEVVDTKPPTLTLSVDTVYITKGGTFMEPTITAFDLTDGDLRSKVKKEGIETIDVNVPGTYIVNYSVSDVAGNSTSVDCYVIVKEGQVGTDNIPPVITLLGADTIYMEEDETIEEFKQRYVEPGYTAEDNVDGDLHDSVKVSPMTQLSLQYWVITYSVNDKAGNAATPKRRFINTGKRDIDVTAPVIELTFPDSVIEVLIKTTWKEPGYNAFTVEDGALIDLTDQVVVVDTNVTNNIDVAGTYQVTYTVTNSAGLTTQKIRIVKVIKSEFDTDPPVITLLGRNPDTTLAGGAAYVDPGATAWDEFDGDVTDKITKSGTVNVKTLGKYTITYTCTDNARLRSTEIRTVYVVRDTLTTDILKRYNVPTEDPLPGMENLTFTTVDIDGDGPTAVKTAVKSCTINWSLAEKNFRQFAFQYNADPYYREFSKSITQTFGETAPTMTIKSSMVEGLDGDYYVTYDAVKGEFIWVDQKGLFALIWTK